MVWRVYNIRCVDSQDMGNLHCLGYILDTVQFIKYKVYMNLDRVNHNVSIEIKRTEDIDTRDIILAEFLDKRDALKYALRILAETIEDEYLNL